jgi:hypothetical protein
MNAARTEHVSISTAKTTREGADAAVSGAARTVKAKVVHLGGIGDSAIGYLTKGKPLSIASCLFAKNGTLVFVYAGGRSTSRLMSGVIALARAAADHTA